jgi:hypothetical protein
MNFSGLTVQPSYFRPAPNLAATPLQARPTPTSRAHTVNRAPINTRLRYKRFIGHIPLERRVPWSPIARPPPLASFFDLRRADRIAVPATPAPSIQITTLEAPVESTKAYIEHLFATAYGDIFTCTPTQARKTLQQNDQMLYQSWQNLTNINEITWIPATSSQPLAALDLAFAESSFTSMMSSITDTDQAAALGLARYYLTQSAITAIENHALSGIYQGVLQRGLHWIDLDRVRQTGLSPAQILQTVCRFRRPEITTRTALTERLENYRDVLADEAALIYCNTQPNRETKQAEPIHVMRAHYASALIDEWQDISIGLALLPSNAIAPMTAKFWFDGMVLQNAQGKTIEDMVTELSHGAPYAAEVAAMQRLIDTAGGKRHAIGQPAGSVTAQRNRLTYAMHGTISAIPRYQQRAGAVNIDGAWLMRDELIAIVKQAMRDLKLDVCYPSGTPLHAIATTVQRLGPMHGIAFSQFHQPAALMAAYNRLQRAWRDDPHFAIAPWLCAAHYLAKTSKVLFLDTHSVLSEAQQIARQVGVRFLPLTTRAGYSINLRYWNRTLENMATTRVKRTDPFFLLSRLPGKGALLASVRAGVTALQEAPETIRYDNTDDLHQQLHSYLNERLRANAPLPVVEPDFLIEQILRQKLAMEDRDLLGKRWGESRHTVAITSPLGHRRTFTRPMEEFKTLAAFTHAKKMVFGEREISAAKELFAAKANAAESLAKNPVVVAKAKEILRQNADVVTLKDVAQMSAAMGDGISGRLEISLLDEWLNALDFMFGSATVRMLVKSVASGEPRKILELLPFVVPLYDIEEGVRLADWRRARNGAIHFGEDAVLTAIGAIAEARLLRQVASDVEAMALARSRMSSVERAGVDMMSEIEDLTTQAIPEQPVIIAEDTFTVRTDSARSQTTSIALETLARARHRLSNPDASLTLFLIDEERTVAVTPIAGGFAEVDPRGKIIAGAPMIFGDIASGRGYRLIRKTNPQGEVIRLGVQDLMTRETVAQILPRWNRITELRNIRIRREDPGLIIQGLFALAEAMPSGGLKKFWNRAYARYGVYAKFEQFWREVYARSDTAVVILNAAYDNLIFQGHSEITFNAERAYVSGNNICLLGDKDLADLQYVSLSGVTTFQRKRMWVHEALHALGKWKDASDSYNNRGGTVYLTERILWELESATPIPARLAYKIPPSFKDDEAVHRAWSENLFHLHDVAVAEDKILDRALDAGRDFSLPLMLGGRSITERVTVRQGLALVDFVKSHNTFYPHNLRYLLETIAANFNMPRQSTYREMLETLLFKSQTMRRLTIAWLAKFQHARIRVKPVDFGFHERVQDREVVGHVISSKTIWINSEALYYFSDAGVSTMSAMRMYAGGMINFFLSEMIPVEWGLELSNRWTDRGLGVLLENEVLQQTGDDSPTRICIELLAKSDAYLRHPTFIRRSANLEDHYLRQATRGGQLITDPAAIAVAENDILDLGRFSQ